MAEALYRFAIQRFSSRPVAQQRAAARLEPEPEVGAAGLCRPCQSVEGFAGQLMVPAARGRLDQLRQHPHEDPVVEGVGGGVTGRGCRLLIAS